MSLVMDAPGSQSSAEFATLDLERVTEIGRRHQVIGEFLEQEGFSALVLQQPANFSWLTAGGDSRCGGTAETSAWLFVTPDARVVICNNVDSPGMFEHQIRGMGFQLKERPWTEPRVVLLNDLCRGRRVASDLPHPGATDVGHRLLNLRLPLPEFDQQRMRELGALVTHAVEATARGLTKGRTEADLAGEMSHRMLRHGVTPVRLQVLADARRARFRHWTFSTEPVQRCCTLLAVGRLHGLHVGVARTVSLGEPTPEVLAAYERLALVTATGLYFSQVDWDLHEVWSRVQRIYEKSGAIDEWRLGDQADVMEYECSSVPVMPTSQYRLAGGTPLFWHQSVGPVMSGESLIVTHRGAERITLSADWPQIPISVKGVEIQVPAILVVPQTSKAPATI